MRRQVLTTVLITALAATPVWSQTLQEQIVGQLQSQGFSQISVSRTWLGRTRITAQSATQKREVIFDSSGEILRDYWQDSSGNAISPGLVDSHSNGSGINSGTSNDSGDTSGNSGTGGDSGDSGGDSGDSGDSGGSGGGGEQHSALTHTEIDYLTGGRTHDLDFTAVV